MSFKFNKDEALSWALSFAVMLGIGVAAHAAFHTYSVAHDSITFVTVMVWGAVAASGRVAKDVSAALLARR
jgi:hypothetical protein